MKPKEFMFGVATRPINYNNDYFRCSKCKRIFDISDNVHTKTDEIDYHLCNECFTKEASK